MKDLKQNQRFFAKFKEGQTICQAIINVDDLGERQPKLSSFYLHSHKEVLPTLNKIITKMNESYINWQNKVWGTDLTPNITRPRKKGLRQLKVLIKNNHNVIS
jgi:hypothetical protein